jgi:hypothetical protein
MIEPAAPLPTTSHRLLHGFVLIGDRCRQFEFFRWPHIVGA